ncbi:MAG: metallophosphoesterase family protein [Syntrophales bacterium]|nr:metallophosphoesterase family protein [Syntrophales bacterium]
MRIYAVADIHGRRNRIEAIIKNTDEINPDVVVIAGDITGYARDVATISQLNGLTAPVLSVLGNVDSPDVSELLGAFQNITPIHMHEVIMEGVPFVGLNGHSTLPFLAFLTAQGNRHDTENIGNMVGNGTVFVTHAPPVGVLDKGFGGLHGGSKELAGLIRDKQPRVMICGHIHENRGAAFMGSTLVVNCSMGHAGSGALIELSPDRPAKATLLP